MKNIEEMMRMTKAELNIELALTGNELTHKELAKTKKEVMVEKLRDKLFAEHVKETEKQQKIHNEVDQKNTEMDIRINEQEVWTCPTCKETTTDFPAISRRDNKTEICSKCGTSEAIEDFNNKKNGSLYQSGKSVVTVAGSSGGPVGRIIKDTLENGETAKKLNLEEEAEDKEAEEAMDAHMELEAEREAKAVKEPKDERKQESKEDKTKKTEKVNSVDPKVNYDSVFDSIQKTFNSEEIEMFKDKTPKKSYLVDRVNRNYWWVIALSKNKTQLELCGTDLTNMKTIWDNTSPRCKALELIHRDGSKRSKICRVIEGHQLEEIATVWKKFEKLVKPQLKKVLPVVDTK